MNDFFARLFGKKPATSRASVPTELSQPIPAEYKGPVTFVWHRNAQGKPTGAGVEFPPGGGPGTMVTGRNPDMGSAMFSIGAIMRRSLEPGAQRRAARWAGASVNDDGEPLWDIESEQRFAEAFVEYTNETQEPGSQPALVPMNLGRPPLTAEMRRLFENPYEEVESENT